MKALSIWQPYASLIAINAKQYETRSWATKYRGPIAIHAAAKSPAAVYRILDSDVVREIEKAIAPLAATAENIGHLRAKCLPLGKVIAIANLTDCIEITPAFAASVSAEERAFGDWTLGRYAWKLESVNPLPFFIPAKGQQGIWNFQTDKINEKGEYTQ
jgi:hypothetical protein